MKKRVFQIVTLAVFVILLSVTLCACSLLGSGSKDKDKDGNVDKKLSGIFPTTETPKWSSASGEIFEYREESDEESGSQKIIVIGLKKKTEKQVVIPDGVNKIDENAFAGCNNIISLVISDTVTSIGRGAFRDCTGLIGVSVGKNVSDIGDEAFGGCYKLVEVYNKSSLDIMARSVDNGNIGYYAKNVYDKADLTRLDVDDNNYISYLDGDKKTLMGYSGTGTELALPDGVTDIYHYAFAFNDSVKKVTMSKDVIMTGDGVFAGCTALKYVEFSGKITKISYGAFYGCTALNSIAVPETVTSVGENAFALCTSLTRVTVGTNVKKIEEAAFYNCYKLVEVYNKSSLDIKAEAASDNETSVDGDNEGYGDIGRYVKHVYKESGKSRLTTDEKGFVVYADGIKKILVNYIGEETAPILPSEVTEINDYAFYDCDKITEIKIPSGVTSIGKSAFLGCDELTEITIPAETTSIGGDGILRDCPKLAKVSLPTSAIKALNGASVKKVVVTSGETIPDMAFSGLKKMTEIILPAGLTVIGNGAFYGCTGLTDIIIPDTVTVIGNGAFYGCTGLTDVIIPDTVTGIGFYAFADCEGMKALYYKGTAEQWNKITVLGEIGTEAKRYFYSETAPTKEGNYWRYYDGKVFVWETVHIHSFGEWTEKTPATCLTDKVERRECRSCGVEQTRTVEKTALGHDYDENGICKRCQEKRPTEDVSLFTFEYDEEQDGYTVTEYLGEETEVIIPKKYNDGKIGEKEIKTIGERAFREKTALISITIPDSVTSIGDEAFRGCSGLTSITIPDSVTSIGEDAFYNCSGLTSVTIGNGVTSIGVSAFYYCSGLTSVTIGSGVMSIGDDAFYVCDKLVEVYNKSSLNITAGSDAYGYVGYYAKNVYTEEGQTKLTTDENGYIIYTDGDTNLLLGYTGGKADIVLPQGITEIYKYAFYKNKILNTVTIPDSVTSIGDFAFDDCVGLTDVHYNGTKEQWNGITKAENIGFNDGVTRTIHCTDGTIVIGDVSGGGSEEAVGE